MTTALMETHAGTCDQEARFIADDPVKPEFSRPRGSLGRISLSDWVATALAGSGWTLNVAGIHQDEVTREWATQVADRAIQLVGEGAVRSTWWKIGGRCDAGEFRDAVQAATAADILIVSVRTSEELSPDLYEWIEAWLRLRLPLAGTLVALIGAPEQAGADTDRIGDYLEDVARRGDLEFLLQEQELPVELPEFSREETAERPFAQTQVFSGIMNTGHWGINE